MFLTPLLRLLVSSEAAKQLAKTCYIAVAGQLSFSFFGVYCKYNGSLKKPLVKLALHARSLNMCSRSLKRHPTKLHGMAF